MAFLKKLFTLNLKVNVFRRIRLILQRLILLLTLFLEEFFSWRQKVLFVLRYKVAFFGGFLFSKLALFFLHEIINLLKFRCLIFILY